MSWRDHIVVDPAVLVGKPVIKGTRISVELLLDRLADAWSYDDILTAYPHLAREQVQAAVQFASELFKEERFVATAKSSRVMWPGLLVNENFPAPATQALRSSGVDVFSVSEQLPGASDESVLAVACAQARWLVTFDNDYGELLFARRLPAPPAVLLLREMHYRPDEPAAWVLPLLAQVEEIEGYFCVWRRDGMRKRPLLRPVRG